MEFCYYCGSPFCAEECSGAHEAEEYAIAEHVRTCKKRDSDEGCYICECM